VGEDLSCRDIHIHHQKNQACQNFVKKIPTIILGHFCKAAGAAAEKWFFWMLEWQGLGMGAVSKTRRSVVRNLLELGTLPLDYW
jgi:hypothetical protein